MFSEDKAEDGNKPSVNIDLFHYIWRNKVNERNHAVLSFKIFIFQKLCACARMCPYVHLSTSAHRDGMICILILVV